MAIKLSNNAVSHLAGALAQADTQIILMPGEGAMFPALDPGDFFPATLVNAAGQYEIVRVTGRSNDTLTVLRAQEGTAALDFSAGARIELRFTSGVFTLLQQAIDAKFDKAGGTVSGALNVTGALTQGGDQVWHTGNLDPAVYAPLTGPTFTGRITGATLSMAMNQDNGATQGSFVCRATGSGDNNMAGMAFSNDAYAIKLGVRADGYFGLGGWSSSTWRWYSDGSGNMTASGNVTAYSDPRLKDDVSRISGALAIIEQLDGVRFTWNDRTKLIGRPGERDIGVLADQVEAVLPEIVGRSIADEENGGEQWRVVAYDKLVPVLIEAVKELAGEMRTIVRGL